MNFKFITVYIISIMIMFICVSLYVFDRLENYKREIIRINNYQKIVLNRQQEDVQMLFNRINHNDARWQDMEERLEKAEYRINHRY